MNYARIYAEFIDDRKAKQPQAPDYFEKHHIKPRCLGGGDEPENIIRLTPEDHLFAHMLLAKVHGGKLWVAVYAMCYLVNRDTKRRRKFANRTKFGHVRRALAGYYRAVLSGAHGKIADQTTHTLHHFDGREASGNRFDLEAKTGVTRQQISAVLRGAKKNAHGWYSKAHNPEGISRAGLISLAVRSDERHSLFHHDGREWAGTKAEFSQEFCAKLYFQTERGDVMGWHRTKEDALAYQQRLMAKVRKAVDARGSIAGADNPNADKTAYRFLIIDTGEVVEITRWNARQRFGVTSSGLSALFNGRQKQTGGIALA
mgnify:CR=1 FL=1